MVRQFVANWPFIVCSTPRPSDITAATGIQKGSTKVFLRQHAFDSMEKLRSKLLTASAIKIQAIARRFVFRCRFIRTMYRIVLGQASARRFLARKYLKAIKQKRAATRIQTLVRVALAHDKFVRQKFSADMLQRVYRGHAGRKRCKSLYETTKRDEIIFISAVVIQCMYRLVVARKIYAEVKLIKRRPSKTIKQLQGKALKEAIQADRTAAVARQTAKDRTKQVDNLTSKLAGSKNSAEKARLAMDELKMVRAELAAALAELETVKNEAATASVRVEKLEEENTVLKEKLESGDFVTGEAYKSRMYSDYPDLEELDKQMFSLSFCAKKSKEDLNFLISSLAILK
jgi:myosin heavy subunit